MRNLVLVTAVLLFGCNIEEKDYSASIYSDFDVQGHRGCRGTFPENSLAGFIQALEWGVSTLEMDVVISKDHQVVVSHEPFMSHMICLDKSGSELDSTARYAYNMYQMTYQEISTYDCGTKTHSEFTDQTPMPGPKPLLRDVIQAVENRRNQINLPPVMYNIETKYSSVFSGIFHPDASKFVELVLAVVKEEGIENQTIIQSFEPSTLRELRVQNAEIKTALLVNNNQDPLFNFIQLGFEPTIFSPEYKLVTDSLVRYLHRKNIAVIPWTVNDPEQMEKCIDLGVDGIITDYPEVLLKQLGRFRKNL